MNKMREMWDSRYSEMEYAYGIHPNKFFASCLNEYPLSGSLLLPAEGEGRNAVFAAKKGLDVTAFDISTEGKKKALKLAENEDVEINYEVGNLFDLNLLNEKFDVAALIFAHFPPPILSKYHKKIADLINEGGTILLEGFSKNNLTIRHKNQEVGGPTNIDMLFSTQSIKDDFPNFEIIKLEEEEVHLSEGNFHNGKAKVIRFIGRKVSK